MVNQQKLFFTILFVSSLAIVSCTKYANYSGTPWEEQENPPWENPEVNAINREMPRAHFIPFASIDCVGVEDAAGDEMKRMFAILIDDRMTGVVSPLKANDNIRLLGKKIDDSAFAFVAPLGADNRGNRPAIDQYIEAFYTIFSKTARIAAS